MRCRCRSRGEEEFVSSVSTGKKAYDTSHAFRLPQVRTYERVLIVLLFQAKLTDGSQGSLEFIVAVPALKQLATMDSMELSDFLKLLSMNEELLNTLVKCDIVSTASPWHLTSATSLGWLRLVALTLFWRCFAFGPVRSLAQGGRRSSLRRESLSC